MSATKSHQLLNHLKSRSQIHISSQVNLNVFFDGETSPSPKSRTWIVDKEVENVDLIEDSEIDAIEESLEINILRDKLTGSLRSLQQLRPPEGLATGIEEFDSFLLWRGLPKGELTLLNGKPESGASILWMSVAKQVRANKKCFAWINSDLDLRYNRTSDSRFDEKKFFESQKKEKSHDIFGQLKALICSSAFELVGCHLPKTFIKNHQLEQLRKLARQFQVALVIICPSKQWASHPLFGLVIDCARDLFTVKRALHRPIPFSIQGSSIHENFSHQFAGSSRVFMC